MQPLIAGITAAYLILIFLGGATAVANITAAAKAHSIAYKKSEEQENA